MKIGVFDSGFGGINILKGIVKTLPQYDYIYLGDSARNPYGTRSPETIFEFTKQSVEFLFKQNCQIIILACNTASSDALRKIQMEYLPKKYPERKVLGVLIPASEVAANKTKNKRIGILATEATVSSESFKREILKLDPKIKIFQKSAPLFVPIVEAGEEKSIIADDIVKKYLPFVYKNKIDTLILGCTHYGILKSKIKKHIPKSVQIISEEDIIGGKLQDYLKRHHEIEKKLSKKKQRIFYSTDITDRFKILGSRFFGSKIKVKKVHFK